MILEGNQRGYGAELAKHLLNPRDNDHVTVHAIDGAVADDLAGALLEAEAISGATQCQKYLFSLSLNPPKNETVSVESFEAAIADVECKLGLVGQPRAIVFHEKEGRRHAHVVWSRIDAGQMKAIKLSHYKRKLGDVSRDLYRTHAWDMPEGFKDSAKRDPKNYSRDESQQSKREKRDPKELKTMFKGCWESSDSRASFEAALLEHGFLLARGNRRGFVAVDANGKVWSLSRWCGVKPREMRRRLGSEEALPALEDVLAQRTSLKQPKQNRDIPEYEEKRIRLVQAQWAQRETLLEAQRARREAELRLQASNRPKGLRAAFLRVTGAWKRIEADAERAAAEALRRDRAEQQVLINKHLEARRRLDREALIWEQQRAKHRDSRVDPRQSFEAPSDDLAFTAEELQRDPARILAHISHTKARFDRTDVLRALAKRIDSPMALKAAADKALASPQVVRLDENRRARHYTTKDYQAAEKQLLTSTARLAHGSGFGVEQAHVARAMQSQDRQMRKAFGGSLSQEQRAAIHNITSGRQLSSVVGLAGAGKSTMLATAIEAWQRQGTTVHGAALSGKAADGLQSASGIQSRTLASFEHSWENSYAPIAKGDVLVIDEAGMLGTRQLSRVAKRMEEIGAKLVLVGDPDQLQPIEAGTPFRQLVERHGAAQLTEIHLQQEEWQRDASLRLAKGDIGEALASYKEHDGVCETRYRDQAIEALVENYAMDASADPTKARLAFAHRRKDVRALNQAIRNALRSGNEAKPETLFTTDTGKRAFAEGDRIVFTRNDRELGLKNGMLGTVTRSREGRLTVTIEGDTQRRVTIDPSQYQSFDHGYAVTIHKSQGATVDQGYVLGSRTMDRHLAYVAMTRHREDLRVFIADEDRPRWGRVARDRATRNVARHQGPTIG